MTDKPIRWVLYPWFEEHGVDHIHPDDIDKLRSLSPYSLIFKDTGIEAGFHLLEYGGETFRVTDTLIQEISVHQNQIIELGTIVELHGKDDHGEVVGIAWHHKDQKPVYTLKINGKKKSKRYWPEDLSLADALTA